jgi:hypothetical protein
MSDETWHDWQRAGPPDEQGAYPVRCTRCPATGTQPPPVAVEFESNGYFRDAVVHEVPNVVPDRPAYLDNCPLPVPRMTDETIPPALSADEWAAREVVRQTQAAEFSFVQFDPDGWLAIGARRLERQEPDGLRVGGQSTIVPALMALANDALPDGDPRKLTRADVEALDIAVQYDEGLCFEHGSIGHDDAMRHARLHALAAKIAALLPPE